MMPGRDGFELCRLMRVNPRFSNTSVVMICSRMSIQSSCERLSLGRYLIHRRLLHSGQRLSCGSVGAAQQGQRLGSSYLAHSATEGGSASCSGSGMSVVYFSRYLSPNMSPARVEEIRSPSSSGSISSQGRSSAAARACCSSSRPFRAVIFSGSSARMFS